MSGADLQPLHMELLPFRVQDVKLNTNYYAVYKCKLGRHYRVLELRVQGEVTAARAGQRVDVYLQRNGTALADEGAGNTMYSAGFNTNSLGWKLAADTTPAVSDIIKDTDEIYIRFRGSPSGSSFTVAPVLAQLTLLAMPRPGDT